MRKTFLRMLLLCITGAFILTLAFSFWLQTNEAKENAIEVMELKLQDLSEQIKRTSDNLDTVRDFADEMLLLKTRQLRSMLMQHPEYASSQKAWDELCHYLQVDEAHLSDEKGILIASHPQKYTGYDMNSADQSSAFMPCLTDKNFSLVQPPLPNGIEGSLIQYAGVARQDRPGIIQIGMSAEWQRKVIQTADFTNLGGGLRIGQKGMILLCRNNMILSSPDLSDLGRPIQWFGLTPENLDSAIPQTVRNFHGEKFIIMASRMEDIYFVGMIPYSEMYFSRNDLLYILICCNFVVFGIIFILISELVQKIVIRGIERVNCSLQKIAAGDLHERVNERSNPEFIMLSDGINSTVSALKAAYDKEAAHMKMELQFAQDIQLSALPDCRNPFPQFPEIAIYGNMRPAKVVGGDFFDFFQVGSHCLTFIVADVSDKGVPAALFMMTAKTLIKNLCQPEKSLADVFKEANDRLCENNVKQMFVTAMIGQLDISTGKLSLINAGHCQPLLKHFDGQYEYLKIKPNFVLAGMGNISYHECPVNLKAGDQLFFYTDGVTEALNDQMELFGEKRLQELLNSTSGITAPDELIHVMQKGLDNFIGEVEQADDITMLALRYAGCNHLRILAIKEKFPEVQEFVEHYLEEFNVGMKAMIALNIAVEEIFINIASYAYGANKGDVWIQCEVDVARKEVTLIFADKGIQYDPLSKKDPDITLGLEERQVGGLGIFMVKKSMDAVDYRYENGQNILTIHKKF